MAVTGDSGTREPGAAAEGPLAVAFAIQVELSTRVGCRSLGRSEGILREALASLYSLFTTVRGALHPGAFGVGEDAERVRRTAEELLENVLRPFLDRWHPLLAAHEDTRANGEAMVDHEGRWEYAEEFRAELAALAEPLNRINRQLGDITGADLEPPLVSRDQG